MYKRDWKDEEYVSLHMLMIIFICKKLKNGIHSFLKKLKKKKPLNSYADLKVNLLVETRQKSMVCELQLLLEPMLIAKKKDHEIYEVLRTKEYRENVWNLFMLYSSPEEEIVAIAMRQDVKAMERFMINHPSFDYLGKHTSNGDSLIHFIAAEGNVKMAAFLFSYIPPKKREILINLRGNDSFTPLHCAAENGKLEMLKVKLKFI